MSTQEPTAYQTYFNKRNRVYLSYKYSNLQDFVDYIMKQKKQAWEIDCYVVWMRFENPLIFDLEKQRWVLSKYLIIFTLFELLLSLLVFTGWYFKWTILVFRNVIK
jgi:predicted lipase